MEELENIELTKEQKAQIIKLVKKDSSQMQLTPRQIVEELDRYVIGQDAAKKAVAIALRNRGGDSR